MKANAAIWLFLASMALNIGLIGPVFDWRMIPAALAAWYFADFLSGAVHLDMDYRPCEPGSGLKELYFWEGSRDTEPFLSMQARVYARISTFERLVYDFKKHHPFPDLLGAARPLANDMACETGAQRRSSADRLFLEDRGAVASGPATVILAAR